MNRDAIDKLHLVHIYVHVIENCKRHFTVRSEISYIICAQFINAKTLTILRRMCIKLNLTLRSFMLKTY